MNSYKLKRGNNQHTVSVLVIDDDKMVLAFIKSLLTECGYNVLCASHPEIALHLLEANDTDVLLCDIAMPDISGIELLGKVQELYPGKLVIMMSGYAEISIVREALQKGASDFLIKPILSLALIIAIERNLRNREVEAKHIIQQRNKVLLESVKALASAMDAKEHSTAMHSERITSIALSIADSMGLSPVEKSTLELAAYMHDIGKIGVHESILTKPDKLTEEEWAEMKLHPDTGSHILSNIEELSDLAQIIRHHHERVDGGGYPDGLVGDDIPLLSRILAVADAFDAMISDRPYRNGLSVEEALKRLDEGSGTQFDSRIVDAFINCRTQCNLKAA